MIINVSPLNRILMIFDLFTNWDVLRQRFAVEQTVAVLIYVTTTRAKNEARKKGTQRHKICRHLADDRLCPALVLTSTILRARFCLRQILTSVRMIASPTLFVLDCVENALNVMTVITY